MLIHWAHLRLADLYRELLGSLGKLTSDTSLDASQLRTQLQELIAAHLLRKPPTRAQLVRLLAAKPLTGLRAGSPSEKHRGQTAEAQAFSSRISSIVLATRRQRSSTFACLKWKWRILMACRAA